MSPSANVQAMLPGGGSTFNPLTLPGLVWLIHPDDATDVVAGEINSVVDRKSAITFSAVAAANRMPRDFNVQRPGHVAAQTVTNALDWLRAVVTADLGTGGCTLLSFHKLDTSANTKPLLSHNNSTIAPVNQTRQVQLTDAGGIANFNTRDAVGITNYTWSGADGYTFSSAWQSWVATLDASGNAILYINAVALVSKAGTLRSPTGMTAMHYGGGGNGAGYHSVKGVCTGALSAADITKFHAWCLANA